MNKCTVQLLGPVLVEWETGKPPRFRSQRTRALLGYLAAEQRPLSRGFLTALFWPDKDPSKGKANLRRELHNLGKILPGCWQTDRQTAVFVPSTNTQVDIYKLLLLSEAEKWSDAAELVQGAFLEDIYLEDNLEFETWLLGERERWRQRAENVLKHVIELHAQQAAYPAALDSAHRLLQLTPWNEAIHRQVMVLLAQTGQRGAALAQYEACREALAEELSIEPSEETVKLYEDIKTDKRATISTGTFLPSVKKRHNLPADTTPLIGRELEKTQVGQLLTQGAGRLVTIVGPGGMGKTRLALAVGVDLLEKYRDGVYFLDLASLADPNEIGLGIATALDYQAPDNSQALFPQLLKTMNRQNLLLILDNFEQLLAGTAPVNEVLRNCPEVTVLVTSRQRLNLVSECRYELGGLKFPDQFTVEDALAYTAVQLFVTSAHRAQPNFSLTDKNVADVVRICQLVQGMPLGLVLAASWLELLSPAEIAAEIERSLDFLAAELTDLPPRQRSMQAVFDHSWQMLTPAEQIVLAKLSVFRGGFTREAAERVAGADLRVLLALVNKSLIQRQAESGRFNMHQLLRQFAAIHRQQTDPDDCSSLAHCHYFAQIVHAEVQQSLWTHPLYLPEKYGVDWDNFRQAWSYGLANGLTQVLADLAKGMVTFNLRQGIRPDSGIAQAIASLQQQGISENDTSLLRLRLAELIALTGYTDSHRVEQLMLDFITIVEKQPDLELRFWTYCLMGSVVSLLDKKRIIAWQSKAYQVAVDMGHETYAKAIEAAIFWTKSMLFKEKESIEPMQTLASYFERHFPDSAIFQMLLTALSIQCVYQGQYGQAIQYAKRSLKLTIKWRDLYWIEMAYRNLADIYIHNGQLHEAKLQLLAALEWHLAIGQDWQVVGCIVFGLMGQYFNLFGDVETAVLFHSMAYHHPESPPHFLHQINFSTPNLEDATGREAFTAAWEKGKELDLETAVSLIRSALTG